jgi:uncharacterized RDD family membrane protein YckC
MVRVAGLIDATAGNPSIDRRASSVMRLMAMETGNPYAASAVREAHETSSSQPLATLGARFLARLLDAVIESAPIALGMILSAILSSHENPAVIPTALGLLGAFALWVFQVVKLVNTGQTLGKKWAGVKVVRLDGGLASFGNHFLRGLVYGLLGLISIVFIFREDRRCLHDMAGETKVISV